MKGNRTYYRTAALLGAQPQQVAVSTSHRRPIAIRIPWKLVLLLVVVGALAAWLIAANDWYLMPGQVRVGGTTSTALGLRVLRASDLLGLHRFFVRPAAAEDLIMEKVLEVTDARVRCRLYPAYCEIRIVEREPQLIWVTQRGTYWVDAEGVLIPAISDRSDLPRIYGPLPFAHQSAALRKILEGLRALGELGITAATWDYAPERGLIWKDSAGRRIAFGVGADMLPRLKMYEFVVGYLGARGLSPQAIDVRFLAGPTYSLEQSW